MKTKIIAVCGVDGVGKTSLIERFEAEIGEGEFFYPRKNIHTNTKILEKYMDDAREYDDCSYNRVDAFGSALDFLEHYDRNIQPLIGKKENLLLDRYALCYLAYANQVKSTYDDISILLKKVVEPDIYIYIEGEIDVIKERLKKRQERIYHIEGFANSYEQLISGRKNVVRLSNKGNFDETYKQFRKIVLQKG